MDLRCVSTLHAKLTDDQLEVVCKRRACGAEPGVVVLHYFNIHTGELIKTLRFADPKKGTVQHGADHHSAAVRTA